MDTVVNVFIAIVGVWVVLFMLVYACVFVHWASRRWLSVPHQDTFDTWVMSLLAIAVLIFILSIDGPLPSHRF